MDILKSEQYIGEKLNIAPVTKERLKMSVYDFAAVRDFIHDNKLVYNKETKCYDCEESVFVDDRIVRDDKTGFFINFGVVLGFFCNGCKLVGLNGAPKEVLDKFNCANNKLTNLIGSPTKVGFATVL